MTEAERSHQGSYDRGVEQGKVIERLEGHDDHFRRINGSIDKSTDRLASLETTMDRMVNLITNSPATFTERARVTAEEKPDASRYNEQEPSRTILALEAIIIILLVALILLEIYK